MRCITVFSSTPPGWNQVDRGQTLATLQALCSIMLPGLIRNSSRSMPPYVCIFFAASRMPWLHMFSVRWYAWLGILQNGQMICGGRRERRWSVSSAGCSGDWFVIGGRNRGLLQKSPIQENLMLTGWRKQQASSHGMIVVTSVVAAGS